MGTDSLYYIMDYSGNYYRTNQADQLVSVVSQQDAMVFTFAQANSRICVGKKAAFYCMIPIEDSEDETDAAECEEVSPDEEMGVNDMEKQENTGVEEYFSPVKELTYDELTEQAEKDVSSYDLSEIDWAEYLTHFTYLVEGLKDYREDLASKHSDIDQKICDILHYIELCETNDEEAIDLIELLRVCRENRREIKDELQRIEYFQNNFGTSANAAKAKQALKCIKGLSADDIYYIESSNRKVTLYLRHEKIEYYDKISSLESELKPDFFRIHKGYLVNIKYVERYDRTEVKMRNGDSLLISKYKYQDFVKRYLEYISEER